MVQDMYPEPLRIGTYVPFDDKFRMNILNYHKLLSKYRCVRSVVVVKEFNRKGRKEGAENAK